MFKFKGFIPVYFRYHLIYTFQYSNCNTRFFNKQIQAEIGKKPRINQVLSNNLRLNLWKFEKIIHILSPRYDPKMMWHILKNKQKSKLVFTHEITWLIIMKLKMKVKDRSHRLDMNRPRSRHGHKYSKYVSVWWCLYVLSNN